LNKAYSGHKTGFDGGTLYLNFKDATSIEAGKPYIVKWTEGDDYVAYDGTNAATCSDIVNPVFSSTAIDASAPTAVTSEDGKVTFVGNYSPVALTIGDQSNLFLGAENTLYYPDAANNDDGNFYVNTCRAYFHIGDGSANVRAFVFGFDGDGEATGITDPTPDPSSEWEGSGCAWYDLSGRKLNGVGAGPVPARLPKGIYIHNGKKVVIK